jgi:hypothetical protein
MIVYLKLEAVIHVTSRNGNNLKKIGSKIYQGMLKGMSVTNHGIVYAKTTTEFTIQRAIV